MSNANFAIDVRIIDHRLGEVLASPDLVGCAAIDFIKGELMAAKFEVFKGKGGDYRFRLKAANGKVICNGRGYKSKDACMKGIDSIKKNAKGASVVATDS